MTLRVHGLNAATVNLTVRIVPSRINHRRVHVGAHNRRCMVDSVAPVFSSAWLVGPLGWLSCNGAGTIQERFIRYLADAVAGNQLMSLVMSLHWTWGGDSVIMTPYGRVAV